MGPKPGKDMRVAVAGGQVAYGAHVAHQVRHQPLILFAGQVARNKPLLVALLVAAPHLRINTSGLQSLPTTMRVVCKPIAAMLHKHLM